MKRRKAKFAGSWYPSDRADCEAQIKTFLKIHTDAPPKNRIDIGGIVPHAGWYFSGSIACSVIHTLKQGHAPDAILLFGMHLHPGATPCIMAEGAWETPFGDLNIDSQFAAALLQRHPELNAASHGFLQDNTIELQLPFVRYFFDHVPIVPIGVPPHQTALSIGKSVAEVAHEQKKTIRVIGSTDLTHYGRNYHFTPQKEGPRAVQWVRDENDRRIIDAMLALDPGAVIQEALTHQNACCAGAAAAALNAGKHLGADQARTLAYALSYDKQPADSFVGYVGILFGTTT